MWQSSKTLQPEQNISRFNVSLRSVRQALTAAEWATLPQQKTQDIDPPTPV